MSLVALFQIFCTASCTDFGKDKHLRIQKDYFKQSFSLLSSLYRVIAYNDAGPSEPGEASEPVVIDVPGVQVGKI